MNTVPDDELLAQYVSGECSDEEADMINQWIASDPGNRRLIEAMKKVWSTPGVNTQRLDKGKLWEKIKNESGISMTADTKRKKHIFGSRWFKAAAVFLIAFSLPYLYSSALKPLFFQVKLLSMEKIVVENASRQKIELSDGTKITLDAGSRLYYNEFFGETRKVYLEGEGFFEVARDLKKPFVVHANEGIITVLGTRFGIRAWEQTQKVRVVVAEGKVSFAPEVSEEDNQVIITESQMSVLEKDEQPTPPQNVDVEKYLGWINDEIEFDDAPLSEVLSQLERWYNLEITLKNEDMSTERLTVHIQKRPLEETLDLIAVLTDSRYDRSGNKVVFSQKGK